MESIKKEDSKKEKRKEKRKEKDKDAQAKNATDGTELSDVKVEVASNHRNQQLQVYCSLVSDPHISFTGC